MKNKAFIGAIAASLVPGQAALTGGTQDLP